MQNAVTKLYRLECEHVDVQFLYALMWNQETVNRSRTGYTGYIAKHFCGTKLEVYIWTIGLLLVTALLNHCLSIFPARFQQIRVQSSSAPSRLHHSSSILCFATTSSPVLRICSALASAVRTLPEQIRKTSIFAGCQSTMQQFSIEQTGSHTSKTTTQHLVDFLRKSLHVDASTKMSKRDNVSTSFNPSVGNILCCCVSSTNLQPR